MNAHPPILERRTPAIGSTPVVERYHAVADIDAEWDALASRLDAAPFMRPGWVGAWAAAFGAGGLTVLAARRDGELIGVLPVQHGPLGLVAGTANSHTPLGGSLADGPDAARALAGALIALQPARADFAYTEPADPVMRLLGAGRSIARVVARQPYVDTSGEFDAYLAGLSRKHRKEAGRLKRKLAATGELSFEFAGGSADLDRLLDEGFAIEGSGWKTEAGTAINSVPEERRFYTAVARWAAERGWLRLAFLRLDGKPLAFDLCLAAGGSVYVLKGGFDTAYRKLGPGVVLTYESIERAFADPELRTYELLGTADAYKLEWTSQTRDRLRVQWFSRSPLGLAQYAAWRYGRPLAKRVLGR